MSGGNDDGYFDTRLAFDQRREVLWATLVSEVFQPLVHPESVVVELGAGWCSFINTIQAQRRIAVDTWAGILREASAEVEAHVTSAEDLGFIGDESVDLVFASNLLEHLTREQTDAVVDEAMRVLVPSGRLVLVQPNFRLCSKRYFDDYTHISIWSDVSMSGYLEARGWQVDRLEGRFLPLTVKSRLPVRVSLIRAYLRSPLKPLAGQMLVIAGKAAETRP